MRYGGGCWCTLCNTGNLIAALGMLLARMYLRRTSRIYTLPNYCYLFYGFQMLRMLRTILILEKSLIFKENMCDLIRAKKLTITRLSSGKNIREAAMV